MFVGHVCPSRGTGMHQDTDTTTQRLANKLGVGSGTYVSKNSTPDSSNARWVRSRRLIRDKHSWVVARLLDGRKALDP